MNFFRLTLDSLEARWTPNGTVVDPTAAAAVAASASSGTQFNVTNNDDLSIGLGTDTSGTTTVTANDSIPNGDGSNSDGSDLTVSDGVFDPNSGLLDGGMDTSWNGF